MEQHDELPGTRSELQQEYAHRTPSGRFRNPWPGAKPHGIAEFLRWTLGGRRKRAVVGYITPTPRFTLAAPDFPQRAGTGEIVVTWVGHSSFLLQMNGINILLDPVWGERASPVSFAGPRRYVQPGIPFEALPPIDLVVLSHDHYDHLDQYTVRRLLRDWPEAEWVAPVGVGAWLARRGARVAAELDWWRSATVSGVELTCVPAQHFSGRKLSNRNATLWCGWVLRAGGRAVFYAGDTGRHPEFGEITRRLGPFDAAFIPIGAYEPRWFMRPVHMDPAEAVDAYRDIMGANQGKPCIFIAMHWGTFKLTDEPLHEPPALTSVAWSAAGLDPASLWIAQHGESRKLLLM